MSKFMAFMNQYYYLWGAGLIVLGLFLGFFGNKFVNFVIYVMATLAFFIIVSNLFFNLFMEKVHQQWVQWLFIVLIFLLANLIGYCFVRFRKQGISLLAGIGGCLIGVIIARSIQFGSKAAYFATVFGFGFVVALIAFVIEKQTIQFITSFAGSYLAIRGISLYAGGFPNEVDLSQGIHEGNVDWNGLNKAFYGYLAGIVVMTCLTFYFQVKHDTEKPERYAL